MIGTIFATAGDSSHTHVTTPESAHALAVEATPDSYSSTRIEGGADYSGSAVATARSHTTGRALSPSEITGDSIVKVGSTEMTAKLAERLGFLTRDVGGYYRDAAAPADSVRQPDQQEQEQDAEATSTVETLGEEAERDMSELCSTITPGALTKASSEVLADGEISDTTVRRIAAENGQPPEQVRQQLERVQAAFAVQAHKALAEASGLPGELAAQLLRDAAPRELKEAATQQFMQGNTAGLRALGERALLDFVGRCEAGEFSTEIIAAPESGLTIEKRGNIVLVSGPEIPTMPLRSAIRAGLVSAG